MDKRVKMREAPQVPCSFSTCLRTSTAPTCNQEDAAGRIHPFQAFRNILKAGGA